MYFKTNTYVYTLIISFTLFARPINDKTLLLIFIFRGFFIWFRKIYTKTMMIIAPILLMFLLRKKVKNTQKTHSIRNMTLHGYIA